MGSIARLADHRSPGGNPNQVICKYYNEYYYNVIIVVPTHPHACTFTFSPNHMADSIADIIPLPNLLASASSSRSRI
jgi:hypothetical protein